MRWTEYELEPNGGKICSGTEGSCHPDHGGSKRRAFARIAKLDYYAEFSGLGDRATIRETMPISRVVIDDYSKGDVDLVYLAYPHFVSTMVQKPTIEVLLPVEPAKFLRDR